jgi:hypothetical protein
VHVVVAASLDSHLRAAASLPSVPEGWQSG